MKTGYLLVLAAAGMWGTIGVFFTILHNLFGLSALSISFLRAAVPALLLLVVLGLFRPALLYVERTTLLLYAAFGLIGIAIYFVLNVESVILTNVATASVLLYTAPAFVTLMAWRLWREPITRRKLAALALAFFGCGLVAQAYDPAQLRLNGVGVLVAIGAGLTYALFTVFTKAVASKQSPWTTVTYSLFFGALFLFALQWLGIAGQSPAEMAQLVAPGAAWIFLLGLCLGPTLGSYTLYNVALRSVPASSASVLATIEPVVASFAGFAVFGQALAPLQLFGAALIITAAITLTLGA